MIIACFEGERLQNWSINRRDLELNYKDQTMLVLLPLIVMAMAQECPYCRWNSCTLTPGSLASCSDCYLGALVTYYVDQANLSQPVTVGVCVLCPKHCQSCEFAVMNTSNQTGVPAVNCTHCNPGYVNNPEDGSCIPEGGRRLMEMGEISVQGVTSGQDWGYKNWSVILALMAVSVAVLWGMKIEKNKLMEQNNPISEGTSEVKVKG